MRIKDLSGSHDDQTPSINEQPNISHNITKKKNKLGELYGRFFLGIRTLVVEYI